MDQRLTAVILDSEELFGAGLRCLLAKDRSRLRAYFTSSFEATTRVLAADPQVRLAVIDIDASGLSGAESIAELRVSYPDVRIILSAVRARRADILACLAWGVHGIVIKTQAAQEIAKAVRVVMAGGMYVPPVLCESPAAPTPGAAAPHTCEVVPFRAVPVVVPEPNVVEGIDTLTAMHLSARQLTVFRLLVRGLSNKAIARELELAEGTVKVHLAALYRVLRVRNRASAVASLTDDTMRWLCQASASSAPAVMDQRPGQLRSGKAGVRLRVPSG